MKHHINQFVEKMKLIQESLIDFIDKDTFEDGDFNIFANFLKSQQNYNSREELSALLHIIVQLSNNHYRMPSFFAKIEKILMFLISDIQQNFRDCELFYIFQSNKRLLLFLFEQKLLIPNKNIADIFLYSNKYKGKFYPQYFLPEFKSFFTGELSDEDIHKEISNEDRKKGENDSSIAYYIQNDLIEDFIIYVNQYNISFDSKINPSIYETNSFLFSKSPTLIEYAAFYGSIQIFQYILNSGVPMNSSLWLYSIHGRNPEIISILDENKIAPPTDIKAEKRKIYRKCINQSIKCHHNEMIEYIENYFDQKQLPECPDDDSLKESKSNDFKQILKIVKYFNFQFFPDLYETTTFEFFCLAKNSPLVELFLKFKKIDINSKFTQKDEDLEKEYTFLSYAAESENIEIVYFLLSYPDIDVNCIFNCTKPKNSEEVEKSARTPLHCAISKKNYELVQLLISNPKIDLNSITTFNTITDRVEHNQVVTNKYTPLFLSIIVRDVNIFKLLVSRPEVDINYRIEIIEDNSCSSVTKYVERHSFTPFHFLIGSYAYYNFDFLLLLLSRQDFDVQKKSFIFKSKDIIFPPNFREKKNYSDYDQYEAVYFQKNCCKSEQYTEKTKEFYPLDICVIRNQLDLLKVLLDKPTIDVNAKTKINKYQTKYFDVFKVGMKELNYFREDLLYDFTYIKKTYRHSYDIDYSDDIVDNENNNIKAKNANDLIFY